MLTDAAPDAKVRGGNVTLPTVNHYVRTDRITRSLVEGVAVAAACGERFVVEPQGNGRTDVSSAVICPLCAHLYDQMKGE